MFGKRIITSTILAGLATACTPMTTAQYFRKTSGLERASFDLDCPKEQLTVVELTDMYHGAQTGVTGCGQRAVYIRHNGGWVLNSETSKKPSEEK